MKTLARAGDKAEILRRLRTVRPESVRRWGRMSPHQMVCHVADSFRVMTGERKASPATGPIQRTFVKWIALYVPLAWPAGIATRPEVDQEVGGTGPTDFAADLADVEAIVERITSLPETFDGHLHPVFGMMSAADWLRWGYRHMDHHLRQFGA